MKLLERVRTPLPPGFLLLLVSSSSWFPLPPQSPGFPKIKIPFFYSIVSVTVNIILAYSFLNYFEYLSPAIAYSITNFMLTFFLVIQTIKRGFFFDEIFKKVSISIVFSSIFMILILLMTKYFILDIIAPPYLNILKLMILIIRL